MASLSWTVVLVAEWLVSVLCTVEAAPSTPNFCERDGRLFLGNTRFVKRTSDGCEQCFCPPAGGNAYCGLVACGIPFCPYGVDYDRQDTCCPTCKQRRGNEPPNFPNRLVAADYNIGPQPPSIRHLRRPYAMPSPPGTPQRMTRNRYDVPQPPAYDPIPNTYKSKGKSRPPSAPPVPGAPGAAPPGWRR